MVSCVRGVELLLFAAACLFCLACATISFVRGVSETAVTGECSGESEEGETIGDPSAFHLLGARTCGTPEREEEEEEEVEGRAEVLPLMKEERGEGEGEEEEGDAAGRAEDGGRGDLMYSEKQSKPNEQN